MEIEKAIEKTRSLERTFRDVALRNARRNGRGYEFYYQDAEALKTVCDKLEEFLRKQEEDNSYHSR